MWQPKYSVKPDQRGHADDTPSAPGRIAELAPSRPASRETLTDRSKALMNALPKHVNVTAIALDYPHVMNRIANAWPEPRMLEQLVMDLLIDERGGREGFPFAVADALTDLRVHRQELAKEARQASPRR